jgi:hypothetical protein
VKQRLQVPQVDFLARQQYKDRNFNVLRTNVKPIFADELFFGGTD